MNKHKNKLKMLSFMLVFLILFSSLNVIFQPVWLDWSNHSTIYGFYEQPNNTIETVFVGTSAVISGVSPMRIYENYGMCSYTFGTEYQPVLASYYWVKEIWKRNPDTLKTVVFDVAGLRNDVEESYWHKSLDGMKFSATKYNAVMDHVDSFWDGIEYLIPLMTYHDRWSSLTKQDFEKESIDSYKDLRGYMFSKKLYFDTKTYDNLKIPEYVYSGSTKVTMFGEENFYYFDELVKFCDENDINLLLIKTPTSVWTASEHKSAQCVAGYYNLDFIDFNYEPYVDEISYNMALDTLDSYHLNYYGANKVSDWLGNYIITKYNGTDVRQNEKYAFMEEQLKTYKRITLAAELDNISDPCEYISRMMGEEDYTVFVTVKEDAARAMTETQREGFRGIGLNGLADLQYQNSYIAVIENGTIIYEESKILDSVNVSSNKKTVDSDIVTIFDIIKEENNDANEDANEDANDGDPTISHVGYLEDKTFYKVISGGRYMGNKASCVIGGIEYVPNSRGLNIVVYDNVRNSVTDTVVFDTYASSVRDGLPMTVLEDYQQGRIDYGGLTARAEKLYLYNARCDNFRSKATAQANITPDGLLEYLDVFWYNKNYTILMSVNDDVSEALDDDARYAFDDRGLKDLYCIGYRDSYVCAVRGGEVLQEVRTQGGESAQLSFEKFALISQGYEAGNASSIKIDGKEYSPNGSGINIVIYDSRLNVVVDSISFDIAASE